jgi:ketosteroid isomerase-like protein
MACRLIRVLLLSAVVTSCAAPAQPPTTSDPALLDELVTLERSALDRWITLDPDGYLGLYADEITYFDPTTEKRINGREAMRARLEPVRNARLPFTEPRYELIEPKVHGGSNLAVLTYNMVNYGTLPGRGESILARWNATEVYRRVDRTWRIVHSHWSNVQPPQAPPPSQGRP